MFDMSKVPSSGTSTSGMTTCVPFMNTALSLALRSSS